MTEIELRKKVIELCDEFGLHHHEDPDSRRSEAGWPDFVILSLVTGEMIFRELKTESADLSTEQKRVAYALRAGGHDFYIWRPRDLVSGLIRRRLTRLAAGKLPGTAS